MSAVPAIQPWFLEMVRCPATGSRLLLADEALVSRLNAAIAEGKVLDAGEERVAERVEAGLVDESRTWLYPIRGGIPSLVAGQSISLAANQLLQEAS